MKRGFVGLGAYNIKSKCNVGTLIRSANCFEIDFVFSIGKRLNIKNSSIKMERHIPLFHYEDLEVFRKSIPTNSQLVCVEIGDKSRNINSFVPNERTIYLLGPEDGSIPVKFLSHEQVKDTIYIPTKHCLNVAVAGSIVLYHHFSIKGKEIT